MSNSAARSIAVPREFDDLRLGDSQLIGFAWVEDGRDLSVRFRSASGTTLLLEFAWAQDLRIELATAPNRGGFPLLWGASLASQDRLFQVVFDFAGDGKISFVCNSVQVRGDEV
jgi:hypothetical protein